MWQGWVRRQQQGWGVGWWQWGGGDRGRDRDDKGDSDNGNTTTTTLHQHDNNGVSTPAWWRWHYVHGQCHSDMTMTIMTTLRQHGKEFTHNNRQQQITTMIQRPGWLMCEFFAHWPACTLCWWHAPTEAHQWQQCPRMANATMAHRHRQYVVQQQLEAQ